jgi:hypothetical protein
VKNTATIMDQYVEKSSIRNFFYFLPSGLDDITAYRDNLRLFAPQIYEISLPLIM